MAKATASEIARQWVELYNDGTPEYYGSDRFLGLYHEDVDWSEGPTRAYPEGRTGSLPVIRLALEGAQQTMKNRHAELFEVIGEGDRAAMRYRWSAVAAADGLPFPRGATARLDVAAFLVVRDGKILRIVEHIALLPPTPPGTTTREASQQDQREVVMTDTTPKAVVLRYFELYNDGTPETFGSYRFCELLADDLEFRFLPSQRYPVGETVRGRSSFRKLQEQLAPEWRDRNIALHDAVAEGDQVAAWMTWSGFCIRDLGTIPARTRLNSDALSIFRVRDGRICEIVQSDGNLVVAG